MLNKIKWLIGLFAMLVLGASWADGGYTYDWRSGNSYSTIHNFDGSHTVYGTNLNTGSSWTTTIDPSGNMRGFDSNGNSWSYDRGTGTYINYGTGEIRIRGLE